MPNPDDLHLAALPDMNTFCKSLQVAFGDPDKKTNSRNLLGQCRQKNQPFHEYLTEVRKLAHWAEFDDDMSRHYLLQGRSNELRATFVTQPPPEGLVPTYEHLQAVCNRMQLYAPTTVNQKSTKPATNSSTWQSSARGSTTPATITAQTNGGTTTLTTSQEAMLWTYPQFERT